MLKMETVIRDKYGRIISIEVDHNGKKNPRWSGGRSAGYIQKLCKKLRRLECCDVCGKECNLIYHHKDGNEFNNIAKNIAVLCRSCHAISHKRIENIWSFDNWSKKSGMMRRQMIEQKKLIPFRNDKGMFEGWKIV